MGLIWEGEIVFEKLVEASKIAVDSVTGDCVNDAKTNHPYTSRTYTAEGSVMARPAVQQGSAVVGVWGSFDVFYFIFLELGTSKMPSFASLRPAAERNYPKLPARIAAAASMV